jgi:NAD(P)-dependent dehydrogenase (short-subunit alcohol dehydrogenase family)
MKLINKVAIVTGGAMGIGRAIAERLANDGAAVVIVDLHGAELAAEEMLTLGARVASFTADISKADDMQQMAAYVCKTFGGIDILVNNAGIYSSLVPGPFEEQTTAQWEQVMSVNVIGTFQACKAVTPAMRQRGGGRIINLSSGTPFKGVPFLLHYVASKGAVNAMTKALAKELGADGILVNGIAPGFTLSDGVKANPVQVQKLQEISLRARVIQRDQLPNDVIGAVSFFACSESSFITGQTLVVDGGAYFH